MPRKPTKKTAKSSAPRKVNRRKSSARRKKHSLKIPFFSRWHLWAAALKMLTILSIWTFVMIASLVVWFGYDLPDITQLQESTRRPGIQILARDGKTSLATYGDIYGARVSLEQLPSYVPQAVIAIEDRRFYHHFGLDVIGVLRAAWVNYHAKAVVQGGSTLTQQLGKNFLLTEKRYDPSNRSLRRKMQELLLAIWLERTFTKDQILSIYLNRVYLGSGTYGVEAAAQKYFRKSARQLTLYEAAVMAGLLKAPSKYAPTHNPQLADQRAQIVLDQMQEAGFITPEERRHQKPHQVSLGKGPHEGSRAHYFTDWVKQQLPEFIGEVDQDLIVVTTLDPQVQGRAEAKMRAVLDSKGKEVKATQAAVVAMSSDGAVRAMVGGRDYAQSKFNRVTQAYRQAGSAFKVFIYLAALEKGYTATSKISDRPLRLGRWHPKNYLWKSRGDISLKDAFAYSVNTAAVRLAKSVGRNRIVDMARRMGVTSPQPEDLSVALGTGQVTLLQLTSAYAAVANNGVAVWPYGIREIRDRSGKILYRRQGNGAGRVFSRDHAGQMTGLLRAVMDYGTGRAAQIGRPAAGKTGTTQNHRDGWFIGFAKEPSLAQTLVTGVWFGNDDDRPMKRATGGSLSAAVWKAVMAPERYP